MLCSRQISHFRSLTHYSRMDDIELAFRASWRRNRWPGLRPGIRGVARVTAIPVNGWSILEMGVCVLTRTSKVPAK
jgi:hypothetical protein